MYRMPVKAFVLCALALWLAGIVPASSAAEETKVKVFVSIPPQAYFVQRVGGALVDVGVLVGPGQSPHTYEPTPRQMAALWESRVYFRIGVPFEKTLIRKMQDAHKDLSMVDTRKGITLRYFEEFPSQGDENHGEHHHVEPDPHIWLDPLLVKIQAGTICEELSRIDPMHADVYERNLKAFQADLDRVHDRIAGVLAPFAGEEFFVFHPAFGYFGDAFGLKQVSVETSGKEPGARQIAGLIDKAKARGVRVIFVQKQFSQTSAQTIAEAIGGAVIPMDPLSGDYMKNLEDMAKKLEKALQTGAQR